MNTSELKERLVRCGLPDEGVDYALDAFTSAPSRTTTENRNSTTVRFPSRKQGHTVEGESRSGEYAYILECEQNPKVVAYVSQPVQETIHYTHPDGKRAGHRYTPDRKLPRQGDSSKVEFLAASNLASAGVMLPSASCGRSSLYSIIHQ